MPSNAIITVEPGVEFGWMSGNNDIVSVAGCGPWVHVEVDWWWMSRFLRRDQWVDRSSWSVSGLFHLGTAHNGRDGDSRGNPSKPCAA